MEITRKLRGQARIIEDNIPESLRAVRIVLLEADVALPVVREFVDRIRKRALGQDVNAALTPGQAVIKIVNNELINLLGVSKSTLNLNQQPPAIILMAGLQGAGKTTIVAKLGKWLKENARKSVMTVSCYIYRPAAIEQLRILSREDKLDFYLSDNVHLPVEIAESALLHTRRKFMDVLIIDTAGRLHIDSEMMDEIQQIHAVLNPSDTLFVVDSMMGQDAVNAASRFNDTLALTGIVLTKADGDARGGAALSVRYVTGKPIIFIGTGEKTSQLSEFHPDRIASRILGMGDILSLVEEVEQKTNRDKA